MIQSLELIADANGGLHLPPDLVVAPGTRAILVLETDSSKLARPGWGKGWIHRISEDFDAPLGDGFWTGGEPGLSHFLLDTHVLLWWLSDEGELGALVSRLQEEGSSLAVSVVSLWEIQIKCQLGKLELGVSLGELVDQFPKAGIVGPLPFRHEHVLDLDRLPSIHKDPFDRALVAQARVEGRILVSHDEIVLRYPVSSLKI